MATADSRTIPGVESFHDVGLGTGLKAEPGMTGIMNVNGVMTRVTDTGAQSPLAGASDSPLWVTTARARALALNGSAFAGEWSDECVSEANLGKSIVGPATLASSQVDDGGVWAFASGNAGLGRAFNLGGATIASDATTDRFYMYRRVRYIGPAGADCNIGFGVANPSFSAYAFFGITGTTVLPGGSQTNFSVTVSAGPTATATTTLIDLASWHDLEISSNATTITFYLDGVAINVTVPTATLGAVPLLGFFAQVHTTDATSRQMKVDRIFDQFGVN